MNIINAILIEKHNKRYIFKDTQSKRYFLEVIYVKKPLFFGKEYPLILGQSIDRESHIIKRIATREDQSYYKKELKKENIISKIFSKEIPSELKYSILEIYEKRFEAFESIKKLEREEFLSFFPDFKESGLLYDKINNFFSSRKTKEINTFKYFSKKNFSLSSLKEKFKGLDIKYLSRGFYEYDKKDKAKIKNILREEYPNLV